MSTKRHGFTLVELLIVVVIIGILAAVAVPRIGKSREKSYFATMKSDLKSLHLMQELYHPDNTQNYAGPGDASTISGLGFAPSEGVTVTIGEATTRGWSATAVHAALPSTQFCAIYWAVASPVNPATQPGVITCTGE